MFASDGRCEQYVRHCKINIYINGESPKRQKYLHPNQKNCVEMPCMGNYNITIIYNIWRLSSDMMKQLHAVEMWFLRRMLRILWTDKVTNEEVLHKANVDRKLLHNIVSRHIKLFGHVVRKEEMEHLDVTCFVEGKSAPGRQRKTYLTFLQKRKI